MKKVKYIVFLWLLCFPLVVSAEIERVSCGTLDTNYIKDIPKKIPSLTSLAFTLIEIAVPIIIIIFGMIDLIKAITAGKEDELKKAQMVVVKRLILGVLVFFVFVLVKLIVGVVEKNSTGIVKCMNCFINNNCVKKLEVKR